jgi:hypothetical protein
MDVTIAILTWPSSDERLTYLAQALAALRQKLTVADDYSVEWMISAETHGVDGSRKERLCELCSLYGVTPRYRAGVPNLGNHLNDVLRHSVAKYVFLSQDDRILRRPLDLTQGLQLLGQYPRLAAASYCMTDGSDYAQSYHGYVHGFGVPAWCATWRVSDVQMLVAPGFIDRFGPYNENLPHGQAERMLNQQLQADGIMSLMSSIIYFDHVGVTSADGSDFLERT